MASVRCGAAGDGFLVAASHRVISPLERAHLGKEEVVRSKAISRSTTVVICPKKAPVQFLQEKMVKGRKKAT